MTNISISEINSYLRCRRAWDLTSANRQSLRHKITPKIFFVVGSAVHEAIDAQASGGDSLEAFELYVEKERAERVEYYREITNHSPSSIEMKEFDESVELARGMVKQYFNHYGWANPLESLGLKYVATEVPFSIPLETGATFVGTFDGIATDIETESQFYLVENKTAGRKPNIEILQSANQFVGYSWAFRALTGQTPVGVVYNLMLKRLVKSPRVLKSGELSQDKSAGVTLQSFMAAIEYGNHDPVKYLDYITYLEDRERNGDDRFFFRDLFPYSNAELDNWYAEVLEPVTDEMLGYSGQVPVAPYPNFTSCDGCLVRDLCTAMRLDEDVEAIKNARYEVKTYGTMEAVDGVTPDVVTSVSDLLETLNANRT